MIELSKNLNERRTNSYLSSFFFSAHSVSARFPESVVLPVAGEGHSTLSSPSLCVALHIRRYFQDGRMPAVGTVCGVNEKPFLGITEPAGDDEGERVLLEELRWVARHWN